MTEQKKKYNHIKVSSVKHGMVDIQGEITVETLETHRKNALQKIKKDFEMPGFRKGNVPAHILEKNIDQKHILEDAAYAALEEIYPEIVVEENIKVFTTPTVTITKLVFGNPVEFKISVGVVPEFKLPQYKKIAEDIMKKEQKVSVEEKEVEDIIKQILAMRAPLKTKEKETDPDETIIPELTDEFVKTLGNFKNVQEFKEDIQKNLLKEKEFEIKRNKREEIAKQLIAHTSIEIPNILIDDEIARLKEKIEEEIKKYNLTKEDYFKKIGKTEDVLLKEQGIYIENQYKTKLILKKISEVEDIKPTEKELEHEFEHMRARYKDVDPLRLYRYLEEMLINEKVLLFLETGEKNKEEIHSNTH
jgi:FKBP-type peptidyl-prolyl cis-trans isomerase (trigger factor)